MKSRHGLSWCMLFGAWAVFCPAGVSGELWEEIDRLVLERAGGPCAARSEDGEFLRRIYLDLVGRIPSITETRAYLADASPDKRAHTIDRLLASDESAEHMANVFHVMLLERLGDHGEWRNYLRQAFAANKPWDQMCREMLFPPSDDESRRGAALFLSKRLENYGQNPVDYPGLVRDVGRLFLGIDVQCAQCHDHLFVDDYKQTDYQGLYAFLGQAFLRQDVKFPAVGENLLTKKVSFKSVFGGEESSTGPRLPQAREVMIPELVPGEEYLVPPDKVTRAPGQPKFSPLRLLAEQLPRGDYSLFSRNITNRLWWILLGRGLVHPLDLHHTGNPPSHPELLERLSQEFVAHHFNIRWMLRQIALSETYQRSSLVPEGVDLPPPASYRVALERRLSAEQLLASVRQATAMPPPGTDDSKKQLDRFVAAFASPPREPEIDVSPSVRAALFLMNDELVLSWFQRQPGNLIDRLMPIAEPAAVADELYLSVLTRHPTVDENAEVENYLQRHATDREVALGHLAWGLVASTEFFVNH